MSPFLNRNSVKRIGNAVRQVESAAGRGGSASGDSMPYVLRLAQVTLAVEESPDENEPYIYEADLYTGHWTDAKALRSAIKEEIEIWSATELAVDDWVSVIRIGGHWELFGAAGGAGADFPAADVGDLLQYQKTSTDPDPVVNEWVAVDPRDVIRYDTDSKQLQVKIAGTWTIITGGQAVALPT